MITEAQLKEMKERVEKATPGPWEGRCIEKQILPGRYALYASAPLPVFVDDPWDWTEERFDFIKHNSDFIAHSRTDVPLLIQEVERLRAVLETIIAVGPTYGNAAERTIEMCRRALSPEVEG